MKNEKLFEAMGHMDEGFLAENLERKPSRKAIFSGRTLRNLLAAALAVTLLGCVVFANTVPAAPEPEWEPYAEADIILDVLFGTRRYSVYEGKIRVRKVWYGKEEDGTRGYEEQRIPITSSASREPVSEELAALVEPYLISVGKSVVDPTGTITMEVMAYFYEPNTNCGLVYLRLTDPTGQFCGYIPEAPAVVVVPGEEIEDRPKGIEIYLQQFQREWGKQWAESWPMSLRLVEELSDETTWTFAAYFFADEDIVDMDLGFETDRGVDYRPYRVDIDLERKPTMDTISMGNAGNREIVTLSPVSMLIDGSGIRQHWDGASKIVLHFEDGSSYLVMDEQTCVYGYASRAGSQKMRVNFSNIIDIHQVKSVEIDGVQYVIVNW